MSMSIDEYYDCYICPNNQFLHYAARFLSYGRRLSTV